MTKANGGSGNVTWKWIGGSAIGLLVLASSGWLTYVQSQIGAVTVALDLQKDRISDQKTQQAITGQKVEQIDKKVDEVRKDVNDIKSILEQIRINQQQQIRDTPKR